MDENLHLYFILFATHKEREFEAHAGYIFARDQLRVVEKLREKYGPLTTVRSCSEVHVEEGTILYGKQWTQL